MPPLFTLGRRLSYQFESVWIDSISVRSSLSFHSPGPSIRYENLHPPVVINLLAHTTTVW